jgi:tetratricopeptide (TPR) repeat protein
MTAFKVGIRAFAGAACGAAALGLAGCVGTVGGFQETVAASAPVGQSAAGNYLAAVHAGILRDGRVASAYYARALSADPHSPEILERSFLLHVASGDIAGAADLGTQLAVADPSNRMARLILSTEALRAGRYSDAGKEIEAAAGADNSDVVWATVRAWAYAGTGDIDKAIALLGTDQVRASLGAFALYHQALIFDYAGRVADADRTYGDAILAAEGHSVRLLEAYGRYLTRHDRLDDAIKLYQTYLDATPTNPIVQNLLATTRSGKVDKRAMVATPAEGAAEAVYGVAVVLAGERTPELPLVYAQLAVYLRPNLDLALALRGELYEAVEEWSLAAESYSAISDASPLKPYATISIVHDLSRLERYKEATALIKARISTEPGDVGALVALGDLYRAQEKWTDAADTYARALDVERIDDKGQWQILYARGVALERAGEWSEAEGLLKKAIEIDPGQPQVLNYLGYSWIDRGQNLKEALALIGKAVAARPDDGFIVDSLGWAYYRLGDFGKATKYLEHAVELKPDDSTINDHLGDAYWRVGRRLEAQFQWHHALAMKPSDYDAKKIAKKLEGGLTDPEPAIGDKTHS